MVYPNWVRDHALTMYQQGLSSYQIEEDLGVPYITVYDWVRKAGINRDIRTARRLEQPLKPDWDKPSEELAYILGVLAGDGSFLKERGSVCGVQMGVIDREFADAVEAAFIKQFGIHVGRSERHNTWLKPTLMYYVKVSSCDVAELLEKLDAAEWVRDAPKDMKLAWLRGAWDSEGCITSHENGWRVTFGVCDEEFARLYRDVLKDACGFGRNVNGPYGKAKEYFVRFSRPEHVKTFYERVQPTICRKRSRFEKAYMKL